MSTSVAESGTKQVRLHYSGSKGWLIFWLLLVFPVGVMLLVTSGEFEVNGSRYYLRYAGSRGWLCFWTVLFFPAAVLLLILNGLSIHWGEAV
jgi:hypothetical protein